MDRATETQKRLVTVKTELATVKAKLGKVKKQMAEELHTHPLFRLHEGDRLRSIQTSKTE